LGEVLPADGVLARDWLLPDFDELLERTPLFAQRVVRRALEERALAVLLEAERAREALERFLEA